ncbi:hypothetical protein CKAN_02624700 [Cinnamomum micranthum f. kanehirae]|uniref:Uncharacterized protein n=1 Tax=Cinnamomum micranthum f. kanehirae TaxID=337451 RepID=A0A3S3R8B4_9MAGN|nr:hypothetical protein CKAN_02624700 [Cinnamomum micranthum f. kanehirae]
MISAASATHLTLSCFFHGQNPRTERHHINPISSSLFRRRRRRNPQNPKSPSDHQKLHLVLDLDDAYYRASSSLQSFYLSSQSKLHHFLSSGLDTISDLQTLVTFDRKGRVVIACRRSSVEFIADLLVWSFVAFIAVRFLVKLGLRSGFGGLDLVRRRDRSLGGREVVVGRGMKEKRGFRGVVSPLSDVRGGERRVRESVAVDRRALREAAIPSWWPVSLPKPVVTVGKEEFQREAKRLVRAIMDNKMSGKDHTEDDIIQVRRICKTSGAKISFDTANACYSFYRASVDFVLHACSDVTCQPTLVQIDGEEVRQFIAGLADDIGLDKARAAKIVCAAVAARTRSRFLQAWALEIQGKRTEALNELVKICHIHQIFPLGEYSPEMEMVAQGLGNHLKREQREHLFKLLELVSSAESQRIAAKALGLDATVS